MSELNLGSGDRPLPLAGVTVLDLGQIYQGPYCGFLLAMAGARVIKVEPPTGEPMRARGPSLPAAMLNSGKEAIAIDLKQPSGLAILLDLAVHADVMLMNFAPGVPERLGLGYDAVHAVNDRLVYAQASGFGVRDPDGTLVDSPTPAMDITIQASSGAMMTTGYEDTPPLKAGVAYIDFLGGTHLYGAITTALFERERTGRGRSIEVSMEDTAHFALTSSLAQWQRTGSTTRPGNRQASGLAPYNVYRCADGWLAIITSAPRHWPALIEAMGRPELGEDDRFRSAGRRTHNVEALDQEIEAWTSGLRRDDAMERLRVARVPAATVRTVDEAVRDERRHARRSMQWVDDPDLGEVPLGYSPIRFHESPIFELDPAPSLGRDTDRVLAELLGLSSDRIGDLQAHGVVA
ncbi:MAG: CoA transferase [Actinomycetota bacterium]